MNSRDAPTFEFADSSPVRPGRKHRRGRGSGTSSRKTSTAAGTESAAIGQASTSRSFQQGGHKISTVAMNLSYEHQSQMHNYLNQQPQTQANYYTSDAWDNAGSPKGGRDDNSCTGSLTYRPSNLPNPPMTRASPTLSNSLIPLRGAEPRIFIHSQPKNLRPRAAAAVEMLPSARRPRSPDGCRASRTDAGRKKRRRRMSRRNRRKNLCFLCLRLSVRHQTAMWI